MTGNRLLLLALLVAVVCGGCTAKSALTFNDPYSYPHKNEERVYKQAPGTYSVTHYRSQAQGEDPNYYVPSYVNKKQEIQFPKKPNQPEE